MIAGTLLHFTYSWSNQNPFIGIFSSINESVWEHLKLIFFPTLVTTIIGNCYFKNKYPYYLCNKTKGILIAFSFIIIFFYTYSGIIGKMIPVLNILSFYIAILISQIYAFKNRNSLCSNKYISIITLVTFIILFIVFTFNPPSLGIFSSIYN